MTEFRSHEFDGKQKVTSLKQHIYHKDDLISIATDVLDFFWPLEPTRMIRITIHSLRLRTDKDSELPVLCHEKEKKSIRKYFVGKEENAETSPAPEPSTSPEKPIDTQATRADT